MNLAILSRSAVYFAAPFLAEALNCDLYVIDPQYNNTYGTEREILPYKKGMAIEADHLIIIGAKALRIIEPELKNFKTVAVIFSDTNACRYYKDWNKTAKDNNVFVYAMPDILPYCFVKALPAYQVLKIPAQKRKLKNEKIIICHSPGEKGKFKGTPQIRRVCGNIKRQAIFKSITGQPWAECVAEKNQADIFIDQLIYKNDKIDQKRWGADITYNGAIGKSGLEAMLCDTFTMAGAPRPFTEPYFEPPPVWWTDYKNIKNALKFIINNEDTRLSFASAQKVWAQKHCSPEFMGHHLTRHLRGEFN